MLKKIAIILVNYKDYAQKYLSDCLVSLLKQDYKGEWKIFVVDNESTEESHDYIENIMSSGITDGRQGTQFEIIRNQNNDGFAKGNNDGMRRALEQGFGYVALINLDTVLAPDCLRKMIEAAESQSASLPAPAERIGAVQARLMLWPEKDKINSLGNVTHFLGFGYSRGHGEKYLPLSAPNQGENNICYPSGAAVLFTGEALEKVGLFDEEFWMYNEDQDLGLRLWLAGFKCTLAPNAVIYHKYEFSRSIKKYYFLDRNRIIVILKNYSWLTLILIFPAFIATEIGLIFFSYKNGWFFEKIKVYNYFLNLSNWRKVMAERKKAQSLRQIKDRQIVKMFSGKIWYQEIGGARLRIANIIFNAYWQMAKIFIRW